MTMRNTLLPVQAVSAYTTILLLSSGIIDAPSIRDFCNGQRDGEHLPGSCYRTTPRFSSHFRLSSKLPGRLALFSICLTITSIRDFLVFWKKGVYCY